MNRLVLLGIFSLGLVSFQTRAEDTTSDRKPSCMSDFNDFNFFSVQKMGGKDIKAQTHDLIRVSYGWAIAPGAEPASVKVRIEGAKDVLVKAAEGMHQSVLEGLDGITGKAFFFQAIKEGEATIVLTTMPKSTTAKPMVQKQKVMVTFRPMPKC